MSSTTNLAAFYFVQKYSSGAMYLSWLHNGGVITPTIVLEAYGLVAFGYLGLALLMGTNGRGGRRSRPLAVLRDAQRQSGQGPAAGLRHERRSIVFMTQATLYSVIASAR